MTTLLEIDKGLYEQTIPVFKNFAPRILALAQLADQHRLNTQRLVAGMFGVADHLFIAQGFALRTVFPVIDIACPELSLQGIHARHDELMKILDGIEPKHFAGASCRTVSHVAGDAHLKQNATDYVQLFGLPNFYFHFSMAYATCRAKGIEIGKSDFDGLHEYAKGFSFTPE